MREFFSGVSVSPSIRDPSSSAPTLIRTRCNSRRFLQKKRSVQARRFAMSPTPTRTSTARGSSTPQKGRRCYFRRMSRDGRRTPSTSMAQMSRCTATRSLASMTASIRSFRTCSARCSLRRGSRSMIGRYGICRRGWSAQCRRRRGLANSVSLSMRSGG